MNVNFHVGLLKGAMKGDASELITEICIEKRILDLDLDLTQSFIDKILHFQGEQYEFIQIALTSTDPERTNEIMKEICSSVLDRGIPCYYGEQFWHTASSDIHKKGYILHAPGDDGKFDGGGISLVTAFIDDRCKIEFQIETFVDNEYAVKFYPLDLTLPTTYAEFIKKSQIYLEDQYGDNDEDNYKKFLDACLNSIARACIIYDPDMIWAHDVPDAIKKYMSDLELPSKIRATSLMEAFDVECLNLERFLTIGDEIIPTNQATIDVFFDLITSDTMESLQEAIGVYLKSLKNSKYKDKRITIKRLPGRKFLIEIDDEEDVRENVPKLKILKMARAMTRR